MILCRNVFLSKTRRSELTFYRNYIKASIYQREVESFAQLCADSLDPGSRYYDLALVSSPIC